MNDFDIFYLFINPILALIGLILSLIMIYVFSNKQFKQCSYKYLKMQSIFFALNCIIICIQPVKYCDNYCDDKIKNNYFVKIYFIIFRIYIGSICEFVALYSSCLSGLSCCILVFNCQSIAKKLLEFLDHYCLVSILITFLAALNHLYQLFEYEFPLFDDNNYNELKRSNFTQTNLFINLEKSGSIIRDILGILLLFIINLILLYKIKIIMISKLSLLTNNNNNKISTTESMNNSLNIISNNVRSSLPLTRNKFEQTKRKQTINILTTCFICLIGRLPIAVVFLIKDPNYDDKFLFGIATMLVETSYVFNFIYFLFFNQKFRKIVLNIFGI
jgi:hypothetical protein